jgi:hypothetical protein
MKRGSTKGVVRLIGGGERRAGRKYWAQWRSELVKGGRRRGAMGGAPVRGRWEKGPRQIGRMADWWRGRRPQRASSGAGLRPGCMAAWDRGGRRGMGGLGARASIGWLASAGLKEQ